MEGKQWEAYIGNLNASHVRIRDAEDELIWSKNPTLGNYIARLVYKVMFINEYQGNTP